MFMQVITGEVMDPICTVSLKFPSLKETKLCNALVCSCGCLYNLDLIGF